MKIVTLAGFFALGVLPFPLLALEATDRQIEAAAQASYNFRVVLNRSVVTKVSDGVVTLSGSVEDLEEKHIAITTAQNFAGVTKVQNDLKLRSFYTEKSDGWIAFKVGRHLMTKANIPPTKVTTRAGVVTLSGNADDQAQKEFVTRCASEVAGVKSVQNDMVVQSAPLDRRATETIDDVSITSLVQLALVRRDASLGQGVTVKTDDGRITLTGTAGTESTKSTITKLATEVRGAKSVSNQMSVSM